MSLAADLTNARAWRRPMTTFAYRNATDLFAAETAILAELGGEVATARILDIGIGTGRTTAHLPRRCAGYVGVDYSPEMIERARGRFPGLDLRVMDARDLGTFGPGAFDLAVFSYNGIDYVDHQDRLKILSQIHAVLRPGGAFVFSAHRLGTPIPAATDLCNLALGRNPIRAASGVLKYLQGVRHARRLKPMERREADYAMLNDSAQQYQLLTYYIAPDAQVRQLARVGFGQVQTYAQSGRPLPAVLPTGAKVAPVVGASDENNTDYMVHYLARRPLA